MVVLVVVALSVAPSIHTIDDFVHLIYVLELAYGRLSKINILADKPIPAERSEGPSEQSGLRGGGIAPGGTPPVDHPGVPWEIDFILIEPRNNLAFILFRAG